MKIEWDFSELNRFSAKVRSIELFNDAMEKTAMELAQYLRKLIVDETPVLTGTLRAGWLTGKFTMTKLADGVKVEFNNTVDYAKSVNYGHPSHNQFNKGGKPYLVKNRVKVPTPYPGQNMSDAAHWVFGWFFVEQSVITAENDPQLKKILLKNLEDWWAKCCNG